MTNDFSTISAESNFRDEITVRSDEYDPAADHDPAVENDDPGFGEDEGDNEDEFEAANRRETHSMAEPDESMDGDFDSGMASAGLGYDEQYEHNLCDDYSGE